MLAAVVNLTSTPDISANAVKCCSVIRLAAQAGAKLVALPEASDFIARQKSVNLLTRSDKNIEFLNAIRDAAKSAGVFVQIGVHEPSEEPDRVYNTNHLISDQGDIVASYRKIHLFDVDLPGGSKIHESDSTVPGSAVINPTSTPVGFLGLLTCYDIRFPEVSLKARRLGADIICYPSAFTIPTGAAHWEVLLRARAIETQSYILAPTQYGTHYGAEVDDQGKIWPARGSFGNAMVIDPWGKIIAQPPNIEQPSFALANIDLDYLATVRAEMPLWKQRRPDVYPEV